MDSHALNRSERDFFYWAFPGLELTTPVQQRNVDTTVQIARRAVKAIGLVEKVGIEDHRPIGAIRNDGRLGPGSRQERM
jgi:hypothetical protein